MSDLHVRLLWSAIVLALVGGGFYACHRPTPSGRVAMDFLAAIERGDLAAADAFVSASSEEPSPSEIAPPSTPWHPVEVLDVAMNDSPRDYTVTVAVTAAGSPDAELTFHVGDGDEILYVVERADVTIDGGPADVSFAGTPYPGASGFHPWVMPGIYETVAIHGDATVTGLLIAPDPAGVTPALTLRIP